LALIFYNAYGYNKNDINFKYDDHKRYTMDDIGVLDKRITRTEYYTTLNLSESGILNKTSTDSLLNQRLNSGFFVDNFEDIKLVNFYDTDCACTIEIQKELCKPKMIIEPVKLKRDLTQFPFNSESYGKFYLPYSFSGDDAIVISNVFPTSELTPNPFSKSTFIGSLKIYPENDIWFDTSTLPIVNAAPDSSYSPASVASPSSSLGVTYGISRAEDIVRTEILDSVLIPSVLDESSTNKPTRTVNPKTGKPVYRNESFSGWEASTNKDSNAQRLTSFLDNDK